MAVDDDLPLIPPEISSPPGNREFDYLDDQVRNFNSFADGAGLDDEGRKLLIAGMSLGASGDELREAIKDHLAKQRGTL